MSSSPLFQRDPSYVAAVILFLIENSPTMERGWEEMRVQHLEPLLALFEEANADVPVQVITLESAPMEGQVPRVFPSSREGLRNIRFNPSTRNQVTADKIERAAGLLGSFKYKGQAVYSHMVIVATTDPSPETSPGVKQHPWFLVAEKIVSNGVLCHLTLVKSGQDLSPFVRMFQNTLWLNNGKEVESPLPYDSSKYVFHFNAKALQSQEGSSSRSPPEQRDTQERRWSADGGYPQPGHSRRPPTRGRNQIAQLLTQDDESVYITGTRSPLSFRTSESRTQLGKNEDRKAGDPGRTSVPGSSGTYDKTLDSPIQLPSVPQVPAVGNASIEADCGSSGVGPSAGPPPVQSPSFLDEFFDPRKGDSHSDIDEHTEPFWLEGRALEEALMRYGHGHGTNKK